MPYDLSKYFVVAISSRALFHVEVEEQIFREQGLKAYAQYQLAHEDDVLTPGAGFALVKSILGLNEGVAKTRKVEVVIMSRNNADTRDHRIRTGSAPIARRWHHGVAVSASGID